jgi:hypothetical protein
MDTTMTKRGTIAPDYVVRRADGRTYLVVRCTTSSGHTASWEVYRLKVRKADGVLVRYYVERWPTLRSARAAIAVHS